ncbi:MAG: response regulator [Marinobacterium sp.]|nr:response regulator [Marinobacterium sp.]
MSVAIPVVICDDSRLARRQMARALDGWNVDITFAEHGLEALDAIRAGKADILFLDLNMPVMDGYQVLERIRRDDLPVMVIVVSGDIQPEAYQRVMALGALDFVKKPTSPETITQVLNRFGLLDAVEPEPAALTELPSDLPDYYQEIANVAMGRAGDRLARLLDVFVNLPIPEVSFTSRDELDLHLHHMAEQKVQTVSQGFVGHGLAGEALLMFRESSFVALERLLGSDEMTDASVHAGLLMDVANTLIGAFLSSFEQQMDIAFSRGSPVVLNHFDGLVGDGDRGDWQHALTINIHYSIKSHDVQCDLMLVFTEDSTPKLQHMASYF